MIKNRNRADFSQTEKHSTFRRAFDVISTYRASGQYLSAFIIAFSILEDRLAAAVVMEADLSGTAKPSGHLILYRQIARLERAGHLDCDTAKVLRLAGDKRNALVHAAMWNIDAIKDEDVAFAIQWARATDKAASRLRRRLRAQQRFIENTKTE